MPPKKISHTLIILALITASSCSRHKTLPVPKQCDADIAKVTQVLTEKSKSYSKADTQRIQNLIKAAKIQQQHGRFNTCIDKMNRALTLLKADATNTQNQIGTD